MIVDMMEYRIPGREIDRQLEIDDSCVQGYDALTDLGFSLACERLRTGEVAQTIEHKRLGFDIACTLTNGTDQKENKKALEDMILAFDPEAAQDEIARWETDNG